MANFASVVDDDIDYVNLDHVAKVVSSGGFHLLMTADEIVLGSVTSLAGFLTRQIVPAAVGQLATIITVGSGGPGERPSYVWSEQVPIVAWSIEREDKRMSHPAHPYSARPIIAGAVSIFQTVLVEWPDGHLDDPGKRAYASLDDAKADILIEAQRFWDESRDKQGQEG